MVLIDEELESLLKEDSFPEEEPASPPEEAPEEVQGEDAEEEMEPAHMEMEPGDSQVLIKELQDIHMRRARDMIREREILSVLGGAPSGSLPKVPTPAADELDLEEIVASLPPVKSPPPKPAPRASVPPPVPPRPGRVPLRPADLLPDTEE